MVVVALLAVLAGQLGFWTLLHAGLFWGALGANTVFWCAAFPAWTVAGRRWWRKSATPDIVLCLSIALLSVACFYAAEGLADAAYCGLVYADRNNSCWMSPASRNAFLWTGMFALPVSLIAAALATLRSRAIRATPEAPATGPKPITAAVIAAAIFAAALVVFATLIVANASPPR
jgi:hypothetical protein